MSKKQLKKEELENANGGKGYGLGAYCPHCGEYIQVNGEPIKNVDDGCGSHNEVLCPKCKNWFEY